MVGFTWNFLFLGRGNEDLWMFQFAMETQLSQRGKRILGHELAGLIERALN